MSSRRRGPATRRSRTRGSHSPYSDDAPGVTQSVFGDLTVVSNWNADTAHDGIAPLGFRATAPGIVAGAFAGSFDGVALSPGAHYLVVESSGATTTVRQPIGSDTDVAVPASPGAHVTALAADGSPLATVPSIAQNGTIVFRYVRDVAAYRVSG